VAEALRGLTPERAARIGAAALRRVLAEHTYDRRAARLNELLISALAGRRAVCAA
jgi:spore maturation protein CgeB